MDRGIRATLAAPDGSLVGLAAADYYGARNVMIGGTPIDAPSFVRVSSRGEIVTTVPISMIAETNYLIGLTSDGAPVISTGAHNSLTSWVAAFDTAFTPKWVVKSDTNGLRNIDLSVGGGDVGPDGTTVVLASLEREPETNAVRYLSSAGAVQWRVPVADQYFGGFWLSESGDVVLCETSSRRRYSPAGGLIDTTPSRCLFAKGGNRWSVRLSDGGAIYADSTGLVRIDDAGVVWRHSLKSSAEALVMSGSGDLLAITAEASQVTRFDGATGQLTASQDNTNAGFFEDRETRSTIVWADAEGYVLLQPSGLARYSGP